MPRPSRHFLPGIPLHLIQRGNNRLPCFFTERDFIVYLDKLDEYRRKFDVAIHSYVLMTNHVHMLVTPSDTAGPSRMLQSLGRYYVRYINSTYSRTGTLWEGRFKTSLVDSDSYFLTVSRYVELNPVRAGMVPHAAAYRWSSYRMNAMGKHIALLTPHPVYQALGKTADDRRSAYRNLFASQIPNYTLEEIRAATNKGWVLGNGRFKEAIEQRLGYALPPFAHGGDRKSAEARESSGIKLL
jgi:putative transposase